MDWFHSIETGKSLSTSGWTRAFQSANGLKESGEIDEATWTKLRTDDAGAVARLAVSAGDNVMRVLPPLTIEEEHIREFVDTLSAAAAEYEVPAAAA